MDASIMGLISRVISGALIKIKAEYQSRETTERNLNILECCKLLKIFIILSPITVARKEPCYSLIKD